MLVAPPVCDKIPVLVSYHYMKDWPEERIDYVLSNPHCELLLDSGAFSALNMGVEVSIEEYIAFLRRWGDRLFGYMLLDRLGDPVQTARNYDTMLEAGLHPIPIHVRGDNEARMNELFERSAYVACGGFRRPKVGWSPKSYVALKMGWAAGRPVHWLGYTRQDMLPVYRPYSCDSANVMSAAMYGLLMLFDGRGRIKQYTLADIKKMNSPPPALARALRAVGGTWQDLKNPASWRCTRKLGQRYTEMLPHTICCWTYVTYARWAAQQYGTRVFIATTGVYQAVEIMFKIANQTTTTGKAPYALPPEVAAPIRTVREWTANGSTEAQA